MSGTGDHSEHTAESLFHRAVWWTLVTSLQSQQITLQCVN